MRVLVTADPFLPVPPKLYGGIERIIDGLAVELQRRGHDVGLVARDGSTCEVGNFFPWPTAPTTAANAPRFATTLAAAARAFRPNLVHSFSRLLYLGALLPNRRLPKVMSYQREPSRRTVSWANRLARGSLIFTGCSESISIRGKLGGGEWHIIHNFVDVSRYTFQPSVPDDAPLLFLSRVESIKGAHIAIEACHRARRRLILAGNQSDKCDNDGRYWREVILPQIDGRNAEYVGPVDDSQKNELLGQSAALIVPVQWDEPFGIVFVEALACGTPVISCMRGALPEIIENGKHGFLVRATKEVQQSIANIRTIDRTACRARAESCFSSDVVVSKYEALYEECTAAN